MKDIFTGFLGSILAGICIALGATAYLVTGQAILFPIGLFIIVFYKLFLFTGQVPYLSKLSDIPKLLIMVVGNVIGAYLMGVTVRFCKPDLVNKAIDLCSVKLLEGWKLIPLAILCNVMIFIAVDACKYARVSELEKIVCLWLATTVFVVCGFEHCIANTFYFGLSGMMGTNAISFLLLNILWNAVGGIVIRNLFRLSIGECE